MGRHKWVQQVGTEWSAVQGPLLVAGWLNASRDLTQNLFGGMWHLKKKLVEPLRA